MTTHGSPIEGFVAQVLNLRQVVLTVGSVNGVVEGMLFDILDPELRVRDPFTNEVLGNLNAPKKRVEVTRVDHRFSVATTLSRRVNKGGLGGRLDAELIGAAARMRNLTLSKIYDEPRWVTEHETLETSDSGYVFDPSAKKQSVVKVKDPVVQVLVEEESEPDTAQEAATRVAAAS